jgi:serine/threonine protein kinase
LVADYCSGGDLS